MAAKHNQDKHPVGISRGTKLFGLLLAFFSAIALWLVAIGYDSTLSESTFNGVEVVIEGEELLAASKGYTLASEQRFSSITVVAKGKRSELNELTSEDFRAVVDVSQATRAGEQTLNIMVYSPNGIEIASQSSTTVSVFVDEFTQRNDLLSVSVDTGDKYVMSEGVTFVSSVANPLSVTVSGPKSVLDSIQGAYVSFNLDGYEISDNMSGYGPIELRDANGNVIDNPYISVSDSTAYVTITVTKQKTVPVRLVFTGGMYDPADIATIVSAQSVTVSGTPQALEAISEIVLELDETSVDGTQVFEYSIGAMLPSGVTNESGNSKISVTVTMPELSVRNYTITADKITVENLPEGYTFEIKNNIEVTLIGPREAFADFDSSLLTATVNFDRVTVEPDGSYTAEAAIDLGGEYTGIYVQSKGYVVGFTANAPVVLPGFIDGGTEEGNQEVSN